MPVCLILFAAVSGSVFACSNSCLNSGDKQCATISGYSGYETCGDYNYDSCLEWSGIMVCPSGQTCSSGACVTTPQICVPAAVSVCKVCNAAGSAWVDDSTKCATGQTCTNGACVGCTATTCTALGHTCGSYSDNCGGTLNCGTCATGQSCVNGACAATPTCTATTCTALGHTCGSYGDNCGGTLNCGTCATGQTCTNGACVVAPAVTPTVDLKVNGVDGPVSVAEGGSIVLSWNSTNATSCAVFGSWSGNQPAAGLASTTVIPGNNTYSIICSGLGGSATDSVEVDAINNTPVMSLPATLSVPSGGSATLQASVQNGNNLSYSWFCSAGTLSSSTVLDPVYVAPTVSREIDATCGLSAQDNSGHSLGKSIQISIEPATTQPNNPVITNPVTPVQPTARAQILAKIAQIQTLIAALQQELAALNNPTVTTTGNGMLAVAMQAGNITQSLPFSKNINAHAGDTLTFKITVSNNANGTFADVTLNNLLPTSLNAAQNIKVNGVTASGTFAQGLDIGGFSTSLAKTITFTASVSTSAGTQSLTDTATATAGGTAAHDVVTIAVN